MKTGEDRGEEERRRRRRSYPSAAALSLSRILSSPSSLTDWAELLRTATRTVLCGLRSCSSGVNKVLTRSRDVILRIHRLLNRLLSQRATLHLRLQVPGSPGGRTSNQVRESFVTPESLVLGTGLGVLRLAWKSSFTHGAAGSARQMSEWCVNGAWLVPHDPTWPAEPLLRSRNTKITTMLKQGSLRTTVEFGPDTEPKLLKWQQKITWLAVIGSDGSVSV